MKTFFFTAVSISCLLLGGCAEQPQTAAKKEPPKPPEPVTGQSGLYQTYQVARAKFASDAQVLTVNSIHLPDVPNAPGKAGAWQATFVSASQGKSRTYTYSVEEESGNLHKGVFALQEESWSGHQGVNSSFDIREAAIDTDAAYKTALEKATDYDQKHPGTPISFVLEKTNKFPNPVWRVIWGESAGTSGFSVYVNAIDGKFLAKAH